MGTNRKRKVRFIKQIIILIALVTIAVGALLAYMRWYDSGSTVCGKFTANPGNSDMGMTTPRLCLEIAETSGKRARGLMYRKPAELGETAGMIFIYNQEGPRSFWMKNTFIPLDMIFLSSDRKVVGIVENATPLTDSSRKIDRASQYIVELNAGSAKKWGIAEGARLELEETLPVGRD